MTTLTRDGAVHVLDLGDGENRFTPSWIAEVGAALDEVASAEGPRALVTVASGKIWSNGLDLDVIVADPPGAGAYVASAQGLFAALLRLPVPTVAVLQGHAFAAGAMLALAHDTRYMRADRGYFCLPEIDLGIPFTPGMSALIQARLPIAAAHEAMTTGRRYGGGDAFAAGIVAAALPADELLGVAMAEAARLANTAGPTLQAIRSELYRPTLALLDEVPDFSAGG